MANKRISQMLHRLLVETAFERKHLPKTPSLLKYAWGGSEGTCSARGLAIRAWGLRGYQLPPAAALSPPLLLACAQAIHDDGTGRDRKGHVVRQAQVQGPLARPHAAFVSQQPALKPFDAFPARISLADLTCKR